MLDSPNSYVKHRAPLCGGAPSFALAAVLAARGSTGIFRGRLRNAAIGNTRRVMLSGATNRCGSGSKMSSPNQSVRSHLPYSATPEANKSSQSITTSNTMPACIAPSLLSWYGCPRQGSCERAKYSTAHTACSKDAQGYLSSLTSWLLASTCSMSGRWRHSCR